VKRIIVILIVLNAGNKVVGQNIIPNSSFESIISCPTGPNNTQVLNDWFNPTGASPDYFNFCASLISGVGVPSNTFGHQLPYNGNGYIGLVTFSSSFIQPEYREYMEVQLLTPLEAGKTYHWCMRVSLWDSTNLASNNIGIALSDTMVTNLSSQTILNNVVYANYLGIIVKDNGWKTIGSSFIAQGGEEYIILGNFFNDTLTSVIQNQQNMLNGDIAAYFIDMVYLGESSCFDPKKEVEVNLNVYIPNVLTPNKDGNNDLFFLDFPYEKVEIFNRWGQAIFKTKNNGIYWSGKTTSGREVPNGTYFYIITTTQETYKGYLELLK
jgi:gliding motility-associated-like protein